MKNIFSLMNLESPKPPHMIVEQPMHNVSLIDNTHKLVSVTIWYGFQVRSIIEPHFLETKVGQTVFILIFLLPF